MLRFSRSDFRPSHRFRKLCASGVVLLGISSVSYYALAQSGGIFGYTQKSTDVGCGSSDCHNSAASPNTTVTISTSSTSFQPSQTYTFTVSVANPNEFYGGIDISTRKGTLITGTGLRKLAGELSHSFPKQFTNGATSWTFKYTAPATPGYDTIYATGNAVNGNGTNDSGDEWNWAPKFVVPVGVAEVSHPAMLDASVAVYPNPSRGNATLHLSLPAVGEVSLLIYDAAGHLVQQRSEGMQNVGVHTFALPTEGLAQGAYSVQVVSGVLPLASRHFVIER